MLRLESNFLFPIQLWRSVHRRNQYLFEELADFLEPSSQVALCVSKGVKLHITLKLRSETNVLKLYVTCLQQIDDQFS